MYLTVKQAAERLGVCKKTIFRRIASKELPAYKDGPKTLRISEDDLKEYMEKRKVV